MRLKIFAVLALTAGTLALIAPSAVAGGNPYATMCAGTPSGECLYYPNLSGQEQPSGEAVRLATEKQSDDISLNATGMVSDSICGKYSQINVVTETCPFIPGSGLNNRFAGGMIVFLTFTDDAFCISDKNLDGLLVTDADCGTGSVWVRAKNGHYVNLDATNNYSKGDSTPFWLYSDGTTGDQAGLSITWCKGSRETWVFTLCSETETCS